jgi:CheY-like chemotaxis protein
MGIKLLLADDSITIQKVVGIIFASEDYDLTVVNNGNAALTRAREIRPDVLLVDAVMPGKTGYEVCEEIRCDPVLQKIPILLLTGAFEPFDEEKAKKCGADDVISKPFESQNLIDKVVSLAELGIRRSAPAAAPIAAPSVAPAFVPPVQILPPVAEITQPPTAQPASFEVPSVTPPVADTVTDKPASAGTSQFTVEIVESDQDDDLWGAFDLEEIAVDEVCPAGTEEPFLTDVTEESFSIAEEPESAVQPPSAASQWGTVDEKAFVIEEEPALVPHAATTPKWEPVEEETFDFAEEDEGFEVVPEEQFVGFEVEPAVGAQTPAALQDFDVFMEEPVSAVPEASAEEVFDIFEEEAPTAPADSGKISPAPAGTVPSPASPIVAPAPALAPAASAPVPAYTGELTLSEEQLTALVSRISRDILEKIAWEVVPDLAESIIREEIRKIKEG